MARHTEPLSGGLWSAEDPGLLQAGQLQDIRNGLYLAGSQALQRSPGRVSFGVATAAASAVAGLRDIQFDNGDQYLVAMVGNLYRTAPVGDSGSFTTLQTLSQTPTQLEAAQYNNRYYLFNGSSAAASAIGTNSVVYLSATASGTPPSTRQHGMLSVNGAPVTASANATFSQTVTGYYEYWTTEVAKLSADGAPFTIESTFDGAPATMYVSATGYSPVISMPPPRNSITTHWRVYRSPKKDTATQVEFPTGFMIAELATATAQMTDSSTSTQGSYVFPTLYNSGAQFFANFSNATALGSADGVYASATGLSPIGGGSYQAMYGFGFAANSNPIVGVELELKAKNASTQVTVCYCTISRFRDPTNGSLGGLNGFGDNTDNNSASKMFNFTGNTDNVVVLGGPTDRWIAGNAPSWSGNDFNSSTFMVVLQILGATVGANVLFDYVKVRTYSGAAVDSTVVFPTVVYNFGDTTVQVGKNGTPPSSTTGDLYEDSLVVNDVTNNSLVRYSYPGDPEAFPATYFVDYETRENDRVRAIRVVNDRLVVWLDSSTWRQNYLPSERDASFDRGKSKSVISSNYGCIHPMCVAVFSPNGNVDYAAFVSHHGIHATDGFNLDTFTAGINWGKIFPAGATPIALINDRERKLLMFYFKNTQNFGAETYLALPLSYAEGHWQSNYGMGGWIGRSKICGLLHMRNWDSATSATASLESAWATQRPTGQVSIYLGYGNATAAGGGKVYIESGTTIPAQDPRLQFTTRELYLGGMGQEWELGELYGYAFGYDGAPQLSYTVSTRKTNDTAAVTGATKTITLSGQKLHRAGTFHRMCEAASISFASTASAFAQAQLVIDGTDFGLEDSGRS